MLEGFSTLEKAGGMAGGLALIALVVVVMRRRFKLARMPTTSDVIAGRDLSGLHVVITGANTGLGFETARALAGANASVVLACRSSQRGADAKARILAEFPKADVAMHVLDLSDLQTIRPFADALAPGRPIDVLVLNAGIFPKTACRSAQQLESTFACNHLGHFGVCRALEPLFAPAGARVVTVSSVSHGDQPGGLEWSTLGRRGYGTASDESPWRLNTALQTYAQSKLCNVLFACELARRASHLISVSVHPGVAVPTDIFNADREQPGMGLVMRVLATALKLFQRSVPQGAATTVHAAIGADVVSGTYLADCAVAKASATSQSLEEAAKLWCLSDRLLEAYHAGEANLLNPLLSFVSTSIQAPLSDAESRPVPLREPLLRAAARDRTAVED